MLLTQLDLWHFRNYTRLSLALQPGCVVLLGQNGQGKTNLLEAIAFLAQGRSFRTSDDKDMVGRHQNTAHGLLSTSFEEDALPSVGQLLPEAAAPFCRLRLQAKPLHSPEDTGLSLEARWMALPGVTVEAAPEAWRFRLQFRKQEQPVKNRSHLLGHLPLVSFVLSDLQLMRGAPADRRKWLDGVVAQLEPTHMQQLLAYQRVLKQKSQWLKKVSEGEFHGAAGFSQDVLEPMNEQLIGLSAGIVLSRVKALCLLTPLAQGLHGVMANEGSADLAQMSLGYRVAGVDSTLPVALEELAQWDEAALTAHYKLHSQRLARAEMARGQCLLGCHRDELLMGLGSLSWNAYKLASQGQQRSVVLALKLAEMEALHQHYERPPLLLLDDVMAELDLHRQQVLLDRVLQSPQVLLTTTHLQQAVLQPLLAGERGLTPQVFEVAAGKVTPVTGRSSGVLV
jgi:DNA replication and repair protein RecF